MSLEIFISETGEGGDGAVREDQFVVRGERGEFIGMGAKRQVGDLGDFLGGALGEFGMRVEAGADGGAADGQIVEAVEALFEAGDIALEQAGPAAHFLADGERRGVHEVGAADFDDVGKFLGLGVDAPDGRGARRAISAPCMRSAAAMCMAAGKVSLEDCDMFTSSLGWMGFFEPSTPPASSMARLAMTSLAFMLVCVPLPVCQMRRGNWSSSLPAMTSSAGQSDQARFFRRQLAELLIDQRRGFLQDAEGANQLRAAWCRGRY